MSKMSFLDFHYGLSRKSSPKKPTPPPLSSSKNKPKSTTTSTSSPRTRSFQPNVQEMKWVFEKFDTNKDGKISWEEYKCAGKALGNGGKRGVEAEMGKAFQALDSDGDGFIDFKEFMEMQSMGGGVQISDIESAFEVFDLDHDGKISAEELLEVLKKLGERHNLGACRNMVKGVDSDGDGLIDKDEFISLTTRTMKLA